VRCYSGVSREKHRAEAPVNGGRNYCVDRSSYVKKSGYMLGSPVRLTVLPALDRVGSKNPSDRDNQQERSEGGDYESGD